MLPNFDQLPLIAILRGITEEQIEPIAEICKNTGLQAVEITMNTPNAGHLIKQLQYYSRGKFSVGAGTVMKFKDLDTAVSAGAKFIVMPGLQVEVLRICISQNIPVFPGAFTPTEIYRAWELGASMVKVFPSSVLGPQYFKEVKGPFDSVKLLACGGISESSIQDYFKAGADAAAFGGSIFKKEWLERGSYNLIENEITKLITAYKGIVE